MQDAVEVGVDLYSVSVVSDTVCEQYVGGMSRKIVRDALSTDMVVL